MVQFEDDVQPDTTTTTTNEVDDDDNSRSTTPAPSNIVNTILSPMNILTAVHTVAYYGWIPLVIYFGMKNTEPRPSIIQVLVPII
jgi:hypothetical protein